MKIAIVGSSHLSENEERDVRQFCAGIIKTFSSDVVIISGGAEGVDKIAIEVAENLEYETQVYPPKEKKWDPPTKDGYKARNMKIAQDCDILYCFPTKLKTTPCYHCKVLDHEVTGGCWAMKYAKSLGKKTHLVPLI